jgi:hypothetical protein
VICTLVDGPYPLPWQGARQLRVLEIPPAGVHEMYTTNRHDLNHSGQAGSLL